MYLHHFIRGGEWYSRLADAETGILKSETETGKFSDLIEKHNFICDRQTKSETPRPITRLCEIPRWVEFAETSHFSEGHYDSPPLLLEKNLKLVFPFYIIHV